MATQPVDNSFYADPQATSSLKLAAKSQSVDSLKAAARQFESLFTGMMLKSMRAASPKDTLMGSDQQDFYQDMFDQQLATQLSKGKGLGLADMLVHQLMRNGASASGSNASPDAATGSVGASAVTGAASPQASAWPPASKEQFIQALLPAATAAGRQLGVDPQTLIAHAALETGWGQSIPRAADGSCSYNLFGIKAGASWGGAQVQAVTNEYSGGQSLRQSAAFRSYSSPEACMQDYVNLLSGSHRYSGALGTGNNSTAFATALQQAGYATDPNYASKLAAVAQQLKARTDVPITVKGVS